MQFDNIIRMGTVDSTNDRLKELARAGAAEGTVVMAGGQTAGRGTGRRSFYSPEGEGLYLSLLLRPRGVAAEDLFTLTGWAAVAVREGIEAACGAPCGIKWLNDIYLHGKKLCGILTELSPAMDYVVLGVGVNLCQTRASFRGQGLEETATSLAAEGYAVGREALARAVLEGLERMYRDFPVKKAEYLARYRGVCLTLGRQVVYDGDKEGLAVDVDEGFALLVETAGRLRRVFSGTVHWKGERE